MDLEYHTVNCIDIDHVGFLYLLLSHRQANENISHTIMPTFSDHQKFVTSDPYKWWLIIKLSNAMIGSLYVSKNNEVGIHLLRQCQGFGYGKQALDYAKNHMNIKPLYANINPANEKSIKLFESAGFKHIQNTYKLD